MPAKQHHGNKPDILITSTVRPHKFDKLQAPPFVYAVGPNYEVRIRIAAPSKIVQSHEILGLGYCDHHKNPPHVSNNIDWNYFPRRIIP